VDLGAWFIILAVVVILFLLIQASVKIVPEYERGVIFRLGRVTGARGPGLFFIIPGIDRMEKVDQRVVTLDVPTQEAITRDNVTVKVNAVCYFRVLDPVDAVVNVSNYLLATQQIAQTTLRSVLGQSELDQLLSEREEINYRLQSIIDEQTEPWGIKVSIVEIKDVELPTSMQRAMSRQAEAERNKRAKVILAEGDLQASQVLADAAHAMATAPGALQLRYMQTLSDIGIEHNSTIIFPMPIELFGGILSANGTGYESGGGAGPGAVPPRRAPEQPISDAVPGDFSLFGDFETEETEDDFDQDEEDRSS
jgi:regulator of protease activity HflC (stomatin/prohibitin superfamily)